MLTTENEKKLGDIKVNEVLLEVLDNKAQHHDDAELSDDKENTQRRADTLELLAGGSNGQRKTSAAKPTYRKMKSVKENEVDQTRSKALEEIKVHPSSELSFFQKLNKLSRITLLTLAITTAKTMTNSQRNQQEVILFTRKIRGEGPIARDSWPWILIVGARRVQRSSPLTGYLRRTRMKWTS